MIAVLACGVGAGSGLALIGWALLPHRPPLAEALAALRRQPTLPTAERFGGDEGGPAGRLMRPAAAALVRGHPGLVLPSLRADLAVLGRSPARHLAEKLTLALLGLLLVPALTALLAAGGLRLPVLASVWVTLAASAAGFFVPDLGVHADAARRRADLRHALGTFLDLVVIGLAGGAGVETALTDAATVGSGWAFEQLRRALDEARLLRTGPWTALGQLGDDLGVRELVELAASVQLAGAEGAKVRASLTAKAASLRAHELAEADGQAQATTERMSLPVVLLFAGFLLFIGYPAIERVLTGL